MVERRGKVVAKETILPKNKEKDKFSRLLAYFFCCCWLLAQCFWEGGLRGDVKELFRAVDEKLYVPFFYFKNFFCFFPSAHETKKKKYIGA